ncbi:hypothetical protein [Anabaenopsis elenkinii]|uniref:Uncharacterized protein n=1 Tax=Anabaenopsis elenkinii CCIBt3563 TaxID=2779889 RepID=A0A7S6RFN1_9CYAN|nr:hypothetical protein [Anabaenopsis elenkinii]QOV22617.1 hypothetical protein IM676_18520 [Anabaenopsis elenkinii CCIBt3563]
MGRWTPLILMGGGLAILVGTFLGINFPIGGQETATNDVPDGRTSRVLPANINVNSSSPSRSTSDDRPTPSRGDVAQDSFSPPPRGSVSRNNDSSSTSDTVSSTRSAGIQSSTPASRTTTSQRPIRALW